METTDAWYRARYTDADGRPISQPFMSRGGLRRMMFVRERHPEQFNELVVERQEPQTREWQLVGNPEAFTKGD